MAPARRPVSDAELEILKVLWELGEGTVRDVLAAAAAQQREWAYTTAQTLLNRLQEKGFVASEKRGRAFVFRPLLSRDELLGEGLDQLAERVCDGAALPLLLHLVQRGQFSADELDHFRRLLDELGPEEPRS